MQWLKIIGKESLLEECIYTEQYVLNNARLCNSHFEESAFSNSFKVRLLRFAMPKSELSIVGKDPLLASVSSETSKSGLNFVGRDLLLASASSEVSYHPEMSELPEWLDMETKLSHPLLHSTPKSAVKYRSRVLRTPKTKKIRELQAKNRALERKLQTFSRQMGGLEHLKKLLSADQYGFILSQLKVAKLKDTRGNRWSSKDKSMALNIYLQSPAAYGILRKYFAFPSKSTLKRSTGAIAQRDGFCPKVQKLLAAKTKIMKPSDKLVMLVLDEMAIKTYLSYNAALDVIDGYESCEREDGSPPRPATQSLVFMIRGITRNWKQVIAYYYRANTVPDNWMKDTFLDIVEKVHNCGFKIVATVCDQGPLNQSMYRSLGVTVEKPFFTINGSRIYALYDMPHLLKSVRNNFRRYNVTFQEVKDINIVNKQMTASWTDIEEFYNKDRKHRYRVAPKLTYKHIFAKGLATMKVKLAAQVFSYSVATGLLVYSHFGALGSRALQTSEFVGTMNDLFDSMNSKKRFGVGYASAVSDGSEHVNFWRKTLKWIQSWKFVSPSGKIMKPACQRGLLMTVNATVGIWEEVSKDIPYLMTNRLNQDCIENTFSSIRRHGGFRDNPNCLDFRRAIRAVIVYSFLKKSNSNCEEDNACNLLDISKVKDRNVMSVLCDSTEDTVDTEMPLIIDIGEVPTPTTTNIENNVIAYIAGFLAKKYIKKTSCEECESLLIGPNNLDAHTVMLYFKEYGESTYGLNTTGLKWPSEELYKSMQVMGEIYHKYIDKYSNKSNIRRNLSALMRNVTFEFFEDHQHKDEAREFFVFSFVTMVINHKVRTQNGEIYAHQIRQNKKLKYVKHL